MTPWKSVPALLGLLIVVGVMTPMPAHADETTVTGTVRTLVTDPVHAGLGGPTSIKPLRQVLVTDDRVYDLEGYAGPNNQQVTVSGPIQNDTITPRRVAKSTPALRLPPTGTTRVLTILVNWTTSDSLTREAAANTFSQANNWYRDASYGLLGQTGTVTPWLRIVGPNGQCYDDFVNLMNQGKAAASAAGYTLSDYDNVILYFPDCNDASTQGVAGWGYLGAAGTWINGHYDLSTLVHEQGHNYGLRHTHAQICTNGLAGTCTFSEYGDPYDTMGNYYCATPGNCQFLHGHFSASQKSQLGWPGLGTIDLTAGGTTTLLPMAADAAGHHAAVVSLPGGRKYWFEYRQPLDYDNRLPASGTDGLLVHITGPGTGAASGDIGPSLIDVRPGDGAAVTSATLLPGASWTSPEGFTFAAGARTATGASLTVSTSSSPPTVVATAPTPGATGQSAAPVLTATFSIPVTGVSSTSFTLQQGAQSVPAAVGYAAATRTATLTPTAALQPDKPYTLSLTSAVASTSGTPLEPYSWSFLTGPRPALIRSVPAINATGVAVGTPAALPKITATFSEPVTGLPTTAGATSNLALFQGANQITSTVVYDPTTRIATLTPNAPLLADKTYTVKVTAGIADPVGNELVARSWNFVTGPRPVVVTTTPKVNATKVSRTGNLAARFNESVTGLPSSPAASAQVVLKKSSSGSKVTAAISYNASTKIVTINPSATLSAKTKYTVTLGSGIKDLAGNTLAPFAWSFTTA